MMYDNLNTAQLRRHERVHTPDEWFKCRVCGKKYATASGFRSHNIKKHKGHNPVSISLSHAERDVSLVFNQTSGIYFRTVFEFIIRVINNGFFFRLIIYNCVMGSGN